MEKIALINPRPAEPILRPEWEEKDRDRIIEMAWEDRTPFEAIEFQFGLSEKEVIECGVNAWHPEKQSMQYLEVQTSFVLNAVDKK
jgi:hypothetical protein